VEDEEDEEDEDDEDEEEDGRVEFFRGIIQEEFREHLKK
jgi:hypothetical protein